MQVCLLLSVLCFSACCASPQFPFFNNFFGRGNRPQRPPPQSTRFRGGGGGGSCGGGNKANHEFGGQSFLLSWRVGCTSFTHSEGESFCRANGMRPISLDSSAKEREFLRLVASDRQKYFWTGGNVRDGNISWPSGRSYNNVAWSHTGGASRPQPDNREGNEFCVAVLNNFYRDGVKFHDVSCHHRKPVICEAWFDNTVKECDLDYPVIFWAFSFCNVKTKADSDLQLSNKLDILKI